MADWGRPLDEIMDGMTYPQFRLLTKMRNRRIAEQRRWDLSLVQFSIQTKEAGEAWENMMEALMEAETGEPSQTEMGGGFTVSKRYPLLHELTPESVRGTKLAKIVKFRKVTETLDG